MKDIFSVDFRESIRKIVKTELKEKYSIRICKDKVKQDQDGKDGKVFGIPLKNVPSKNISDDGYFAVPIFLVEMFDYLKSHLKCEGLFRKSGSIGRQKVLREMLEKEGTCCACDFVQPHDVASLIKTFFREMPEPLLTNRLTPVFLKCISLNNPKSALSALTLCCLLLPDEHLRLLKYFTSFITQVANHSLESKMTLTNLAIVFAPNITAVPGKEKSIKDITQVVDVLFKNSDQIGCVPEALLNKVMTLNADDKGFCSSSADELEEDVFRGRGQSKTQAKKPRERSKSIRGFIRRNFKNENSPRVRTLSQRTSPEDPTKCSSTISLPERSMTDAADFKPGKRRINSKTNMSPVRKSPRLTKKDVVISAPTIKSMSHQVALTPRKHLHPIQPDKGNSTTSATKSALPSKFELNRAKNSPMVQSENKPASKVSRSTQKPHVRVSRRASSLEKRRAKYARVRRQLPKTPDSSVGNIAFVASETFHDLSAASSDTSLENQSVEQHKSASEITTVKENKRWTITPDVKTIRRSVSTGSKPVTPYSVTPRVRTRRPKVGVV